MIDNLIEAKASHYLSPVRSDTLPENTRYKDDGCDVFYSCLGCPLAKCRYDDPGFLQRENRRSRDQEIFRLRQQKVSVVNIAKKFGISSRTVHRVVQRGGTRPISVEEEQDAPIISLSELAERSLFRQRKPYPKLKIKDTYDIRLN